MSGITDSLLALLTNFASTVPLPIFVALGAIAEEIIAIIPSPFVPLTAGSMAISQNKTVSYLMFLAVIGSVAKVFAASLMFYIADKLEDFITKGKFSKFLGLEANDIERYGKLFSKGKKDTWILILLRALPFVPTLPVTLVAGLIKMDFKTFFTSTLIGLFFRNAFYLLAAFYGLKQFQGLLDSFDTVNLVLEVGIILTFLGVAFMVLR
jgi:membrane protein DedA with SNARE-associated domain